MVKVEVLLIFITANGGQGGQPAGGSPGGGQSGTAPGASLDMSGNLSGNADGGYNFNDGKGGLVDKISELVRAELPVVKYEA